MSQVSPASTSPAAIKPLNLPSAQEVALRIMQQLAVEMNARVVQVNAAVTLLDEGATVPFIARYRKEVTDGLDDTQLRLLEERLTYLREMEERRSAVLQSIHEQGKLDAALLQQINQADTKQRIEDLYLPFKPKRRTKAQIAREAGLQPLADMLLADPSLDPQTCAAAFVSAEKGVADNKAALDGARDILSEQFAEDADLVQQCREYMWREGVIWSKAAEGKESEGAKFRDYFDYFESIKDIPSHRALALFRGRNEQMLTIRLGLSEVAEAQAEQSKRHPCEGMIAKRQHIVAQSRPADDWLANVVRWTWRVKLQLQTEMDLLQKLRESAQAEAIKVFGTNLREVLLAAPAGAKVVMGVDPGIRTGCKIAVVDQTGKLLETTTIYPHEPRKDWQGSLATLGALCLKHSVDLMAIGNGTASRETDQLCADVIKQIQGLGRGKAPVKAVVSEAGASVYSASEFASREFPDLDVSLRGAVSIARRLQDPLAELVKIDPKSIGVGQYQHDVNQLELARRLDAIVEDCVNAVGVDVNTASAALLARISGLNTSIAQQIVEYRGNKGAFGSRADLLQVPRFGAKTYEQAAGFLRIVNGSNPLDSSSVHPEAYPVVEKMLAKIQKSVSELMGNKTELARLKPTEFVDARFGLPTVQDILGELEKPGRDPRPEFKTAQFRDGVNTLKDLQPGMTLEGVVTNVANFGAFVDIGVHQDGLVHISALSNKYVSDPHEVVKAGQLVKVKVVEVDIPRARIALTMRLDDEVKAPGENRAGGADNRGGNAGMTRAQRSQASAPAPSGMSAMQAAFAKLKK